MEQKFQKVSLQDYSAQVLASLAQEGKLYVVAEATPAIKDISLLEYVSSISVYCSPLYRGCIETIWRDIEETFDLVVRKGSRKGQLNRYKVFALVVYLSNKDVYILSPLQLYYKLEKTDKKGSIYTNSSKESYAISYRDRPFLKQLLTKYSQISEATEKGL